jgi:hypothetical protein
MADTEMPVPVFTVNGGPVNYYAVTLTSLRCHLPSIYIIFSLRVHNLSTLEASEAYSKTSRGLQSSRNDPDLLLRPWTLRLTVTNIIREMGGNFAYKFTQIDQGHRLQ